MKKCIDSCGFANSIADSVSIGMLVISPNKKLRLINKVALDMLELQSEEIDLDKIIDDLDEVIDRARKEEISFNKNTVTRISKYKLMLEINSMREDNKFVGIVVLIRWIEKVKIKKSSSDARFTFDRIVGESEQIKQIIEQSKIIANSPSTVLITGSSGSGKEVLAQAIHNESERSQKPFIAVNCGAIPKNLIESELFGYEEGSFSGAKKGGCAGKFELADGGTIFLDEIGEMPLDMQVTLLRVLQESRVTRIGAKKSVPLNVRVISATNKDLKEEIKKGSFREDLFYRLNVIPLKMPDLKDRIGDVPVLIEYFLNSKSKELRKEIPSISTNLYRKMISYCWPGNIRELENCVENIVNLNGRTTYEINFDECTCMTKDNLGNEIFKRDDVVKEEIENEEEIITLKELEQEAIKRSLIICKGNVSKAASSLGISRNTLYNKMKKYKIEESHCETCGK